MRWKDKIEPEIPQFASQYPYLVDRLNASPEKTARFWFILEEDKFDTLLDDKLFQYFQGAVFDSGEAAQSYAAPLNEESKKLEREEKELGVLYIVKSFEARLDEQIITPIGHEPEPSQDYYIEKILGRIEETLASHGTLDWGTRFHGW